MFYKKFRPKALLLATIATVLLTFAAQAPVFAQSCGAPIIGAINGWYASGNGWTLPTNSTIQPTTTMQYWATRAQAISLNTNVVNVLQSANPNCQFSTSPSIWEDTSFYWHFSTTITWSNCPTPVNIFGNNTWPSHGTTGVTIQLVEAWLCLQSGYTSGGYDGSEIFSNGTCYESNPELAQCGGSGTYGNAGNTTPVASKTDGECPTCMAGNPIGVATGNKFQKEVDYPAQTSDSLTFIRYYNSDQSVPRGSLGPQWRGTFDRTIVLSNDPSFGNTSYNGPLLALAYRPDGRVITFNVSGSTPVATDPDTVETLTQPTPTTWTLTTQDDTIEFYTQVTGVKTTGPTSFGELTSLQFRDGVTESMTYNATQNLSSVIDSFGQALTFTYDSSNRLSTMTDLAGNLYEYQYSVAGQNTSIIELTSVYYPGPTLGSITGAPKRAYGYNYYTPYLLTGIADESGNQYANWTYDSSNRAVTSSHGSNQDSYSLSAYSGTAGTGTKVTNGGGGSQTYTFSVINGVPKYTSIVDTVAGTKSATYDANGNFTSKTDYKGVVTNYFIDSRGLEESRTDAVGTSSARTTATQWHPTFHLPTQISVTAGGAAVSTEAFSYDSFGNPLTHTLTDPNSGISRVWTYTYDQYGHVLTVLGPRTDVQDLTQFTYYSCATGFQCGRLQSVTNALGKLCAGEYAS